MAFREGVNPTREHGIWSAPAGGPVSTRVDRALDSSAYPGDDGLSPRTCLNPGTLFSVRSEHFQRATLIDSDSFGRVRPIPLRMGR